VTSRATPSSGNGWATPAPGPPEHATRERDQAIAAGMGKLLSDARKAAKRPNRSGTQRARGLRKRVLEAREKTADHASDLHGEQRAGDGNRTRMTSLEDRFVA
jgi:hypothetical protein